MPKSRRTHQVSRQRRPLIRSRRRWELIALAGLALIASGWVLRSAGLPSGAVSQPDVAVVRTLGVDIVREFPHDRSAYTQGLLWWAGRLYESTGRWGESTLRRLDPQTGTVEQQIDIASGFFGEGLARVGDKLFMLTWKSERVLTFDLKTFDPLRTLRYQGEGWGLCHDGARLVMSNGSDVLTFRDPESFESIGDVQVTLRGRPLGNLNELECVDESVYANVWEQDYIVRIDLTSGRVTHQINASNLLTRAEARGVDVLNGIAYSPETDTFYITGKWWPKMFEVRFVG